MKTTVQQELKQHFRPEFLNRVDDTIVFRQLSQEEITAIVDLMIAKVDERLKDRDMGLELLPAARTLLSERGYDPVPGARPLRRTIQREIEDNLSEKILFGELRAGQIVTVDVEGTGPEAQFTFKGVPKPDEVPDAPPAEIDSKAAAGGTGGRLANGESASPGQRLSSPSWGVLRSLTRLRRGPPATGTWPWRGSPGGVPVPETRRWSVIWSCRCPDDPAGAGPARGPLQEVTGAQAEGQADRCRVWSRLVCGVPPARIVGPAGIQPGPGPCPVRRPR